MKRPAYYMTVLLVILCSINPLIVKNKHAITTEINYTDSNPSKAGLETSDRIFHRIVGPPPAAASTANKVIPFAGDDDLSQFNG